MSGRGGRAAMVVGSAIALCGCASIVVSTPRFEPVASATVRPPDPTATTSHQAPLSTPITTPQPTARSIATPSATPLAAADAIAAFVSGFAYYPPTYHVRCSVYLDFFPGPMTSHDPESFSLLMVGDTNGEDFSGWYGSMGETVDVIYLDEVGYVRISGGDWEQQPRGFELVMGVNPFYWLPEDQITYHGVVSRVGRRLQHMSADPLGGVDPNDWLTKAAWRDLGLGWTKMRQPDVESARFEFFVQDDAMPTEAIMEIVLRGTVRNEEARLVFTASYVFTEHGKDVTIEAPILADTN